MSLYSSIQLAANSLRANQIGLQVVGQNIANANTPGYIREEMVLQPGPTQRIGRLLLGLGVDVEAIVQKVDYFVMAQLRGAISDRVSGETQEQTYLRLEQMIGELSDTDLSTSLNNFISSIHEILNQPEDAGVRHLAALQGRTLAGDINRLFERVQADRKDLNNQVISMAVDINRLTEEIREFNLQIAKIEGGAISKSDAVGLRDQRALALSKLAELIDIRVDEQTDGTVNVQVNGTFLVFQGIRREVEVHLDSDRGMTVADLRFADTDEPLDVRAGKLAGLKISRDEILGGFLDQLNDFASTLIYEFNRVFSSGQGLTGYQSLTSGYYVTNPNAPLNKAGLAFTPQTGSFQIMVYNRQTGLTTTSDIHIDLDGLDGDDTTLQSLALQLSKVDGVTATVDSNGRLVITSESSEQDLAFGNDTSGVLAALGINTFFGGTAAGDIYVSDIILKDSSKFTASRGGIGVDTAGAVELAAFLDRPLASHNNHTISDLYDRLVGDVTQASSVAQSVAEGYRVYEAALEGRHMAVSGVSIDEETVRLMQYQRAFQAASRYIAALDELLNILVSI